MVSSMILPVASLGSVALVLGVIILFISKKFHVEEDPMVEIINDMLPGVNCGACGFPGCMGFAEELVKTKNTKLTCPPGGSDLADALGAKLGIQMAEVEPVTCVVLCQGTHNVAKPTAEYVGIQDCWAATQTFVGPKQCPYSCVGLGSCIAYCDFGAMTLEDGIIKIDDELCTGCGACIQACPTRVLALIPKKERQFFVACNSHDKGPVAKKYCTAACIACSKCLKACELDAITMEDNLAVIDQDKCNGCAKCVEVCPVEVNCIVERKSTNLIAEEMRKAG